MIICEESLEPHGAVKSEIRGTFQVKVEKSELEARYRRIKDDNDLLAIVHSQSYRPDARELAGKLLLERELSEETISQWRDPRVELVGQSWPHDERTPLRVLLLRPFDLPQSRKPTRRFLRHYLSHLGHVYTLSDTEIKPRREVPEIITFLWIAFGIAVGRPMPSFSLPRFYIAVPYDEDIPRLLGFVSRKKIALMFSPEKLCQIVCTQESWQHTVQYLINIVELVVMDVSKGDIDVLKGSGGLKWELGELRFYGAMGKVVFVARYDKVRIATLVLRILRAIRGRQRVVCL
jgi:hypothetical protein